MDIKPPANELYTAITRNVSASPQTNIPNSTPADWKVTQLIQAVVTQITDKQLLLDIQGIKANTPKPAFADLQVGDKLKLQIEQLKPMPQFRIVSLQKAANINLVTQALQNIISKKAAISPLLKNISFIANRPALRPSPLSADVNAAVRNIFKQLPSPFNLKSGLQLKTQLQNSGVFIENKIRNQIFSVLQSTHIHKAASSLQINANLKPQLEVDLGAQLHRLANLIRTQLTPSKDVLPVSQNKTIANQTIISNPNKIEAQHPNRIPTELASLQNITQREEAMQTFLRQIESSLTHMQHTQLQNLNESQSGRPLWLMELPIKDGQDIDVFGLRISEEENTQAEGEPKKIWNVTLQFNLTGLGKIKAHIKMQDDFISTQFFSEKPETLSLFQKNLDFLRGRLNYNGLNVGNIECTHTKLSKDILPVNSKPLDERT